MPSSLAKTSLARKFKHPKGFKCHHTFRIGADFCEVRPNKQSDCASDDNLHARAEPRWAGGPRSLGAPRQAPVGGESEDHADRPPGVRSRMQIVNGKQLVRLQPVTTTARRRPFHLMPTGSGSVRVSINRKRPGRARERRHGREDQTDALHRHHWRCRYVVLDPREDNLSGVNRPSRAFEDRGRFAHAFARCGTLLLATL